MLGRLMLAASSGRLLLLRGRFLQLGVSCPLQGPESIVLLVTGRLLLPCLQHRNTAMRLRASRASRQKSGLSLQAENGMTCWQ